MSKSGVYNPKIVERKVQEFWEKNKSFEVEIDKDKEKFYCLSMFPYPSGELHMGHVRNYTIGDVISRYQRMMGKNVLQPMGWDAFGLPAENAAIENNVSPKDWTDSNIKNMKKQLKSLGFSYDWRREFKTCDEDYYKWEQWLFCELYKRGLVIREEAEVNWDPVDKTVLANEQVIDGKGWRSGAEVVKKTINQWSLKIEDYAEELLSELDNLHGWPDQVRQMQRNWIGKSEGMEFSFETSTSDLIKVFTTRPDTIMGVTFIALSINHPITKKLIKTNKELEDWILENSKGSTSEISSSLADKRGFKLEATAFHPITNEKIEIWVGNYVLQYGFGALMGVPAHDQRYYDFAKNVEKIKQKSLSNIKNILSDGKDIIGYGAPAKATTVLNYFGINDKYFKYVLDDSLIKQNKFIPETNIQIKSKDSLKTDKYDYVLVLAWNFFDSIVKNG